MFHSAPPPFCHGVGGLKNFPFCQKGGGLALSEFLGRGE